MTTSMILVLWEMRLICDPQNWGKKFLILKLSILKILDILGFISVDALSLYQTIFYLISK